MFPTFLSDTGMSNLGKAGSNNQAMVRESTHKAVLFYFRPFPLVTCRLGKPNQVSINMKEEEEEKAMKKRKHEERE